MQTRYFLAVSFELKPVFDGVSVVPELRQLVAVENESILGSSDNPHVSFKHLRRRAFDEDERNGVLEAVFLSLSDNFRDLLEGTEDNHTWSILFALLRLFP